MGDGRRPDEPLYINMVNPTEAEWAALREASNATVEPLRDRAEVTAVRIGALQAAATLAAGGLTDADMNLFLEVTVLAEQFEQWLTR